MGKDYYIIGAGGFANEVFFLAEKELGKTWQFKGFIDFEPSSKEKTVRGKIVNVIDENHFLANILPNENISLFMGLGDPKLLDKLSKKFKQYNFPNLIHSNFIGDISSLQLGKGNIITAGCIFTVDILVGSFNIFNLKTSVGHNTSVGDCNVFNPACNISGDVKIGSRNMFGTNATVLQRTIINNDNILGASSLANKNIDNERVIVGIPGKEIKK